MKDIVEVMVIGMYAGGASEEFYNTSENETILEPERRMARGALQALTDAGYAVVPVEPTEEMKRAGEDLQVEWFRDGPEDVFRAMIQASKVSE